MLLLPWWAASDSTLWMRQFLINYFFRVYLYRDIFHISISDWFNIFLCVTVWIWSSCHLNVIVITPCELHASCYNFYRYIFHIRISDEFDVGLWLFWLFDLDHGQMAADVLPCNTTNVIIPHNLPASLVTSQCAIYSTSNFQPVLMLTFVWPFNF